MYQGLEVYYLLGDVGARARLSACRIDEEDGDGGGGERGVDDERGGRVMGERRRGE